MSKPSKTGPNTDEEVMNMKQQIAANQKKLEKLSDRIERLKPTYQENLGPLNAEIGTLKQKIDEENGNFHGRILTQSILDQINSKSNSSQQIRLNNLNDTLAKKENQRDEINKKLEGLESKYQELVTLNEELTRTIDENRPTEEKTPPSIETEGLSSIYEINMAPGGRHDTDDHTTGMYTIERGFNSQDLALHHPPYESQKNNFPLEEKDPNLAAAIAASLNEREWEEKKHRKIAEHAPELEKIEQYILATKTNLKRKESYIASEAVTKEEESKHLAEIRELKEELQQLNARISEIKADINGKPHPEPTKLEPENPQDTLYDEVYDTVMTLGLGELEATAQAKAAAPNSSQAKPKTKISNEFSDKHPYSQLPGFKELNKTQKGREELRRAFLFGDNKPNATSVITKPPSPTESPEDEATKALEESGFSTATPPDQEQSALDQIPDGSIPTASDLGMTEEEYAIHIEAAKIQSKPTPPHTYSEQSSGLQGYQPEINNDRNDRWGISSETGHAYRLQTKDPALKELEAHDNTMLVELAEYNPELANDISALFETEPDVAEVMLRSALESAPKDDPDNPLEKNKFSVLEEFPTSEEKSAAKDRADAIAREKSRIEALLKKVAEKRIMTREEEVKIETAPAGKESGPLLDQEEIQKFHKEELSRKQNSTSPDFYDDSDGELGNFDSPSESGSDPETPTASPSSSPTPDSVRQESPSNSRSGTPEL